MVVIKRMFHYGTIRSMLLICSFVGESFRGNKSFVSEDPFIYFYIVNNFLKNFNFRTGSVFSPPDAAPALPLSVQVTSAQDEIDHGIPLVVPAIRPLEAPQPPSLRRSHRIAARQSTNGAIT